MGISVASDLETKSRPPGGGIEKKIAALAAKLIVTGGCFWYLSRQIDFTQVWSAVPLLDFRWAAFAVLMVVLQIPLLGVRWYNILDALAVRNARVTMVATIAVSAIGVFFAQVLPSVAGEGVRAWLLVRLGCDWRSAVTSVVIDRGVGVGLLIAIGFAILLLSPSGLSGFGGYREIVLVFYGGLLLAAAFGLLFAPRIAPWFSRWRYSGWVATLAMDARRVLLGPYGPTILGIGCLVHVLTIVVIWSLGRAQGLLLPVSDAATLFTVMVSVALVPISIGGWGLREVAVITLLGHHGVPPGKALLFSVCFGLALAVGSLPGALAWLLYSFAPSRRSVEPGG
jgi:glycosyltransferase 2 family protein